MLLNEKTARIAVIRDHLALVETRIRYLSLPESAAKRPVRMVLDRLRSSNSDPEELAPFFDLQHYAIQAGQAFATETECAVHYLGSGAARMLDPSPYFSSAWYESRHPAERGQPSNPLERYLRVGWHRGDATGPNFDTAYYQGRYPDVAGVDALPSLQHFMQFGLLEDRRPVAHRAAATLHQWMRNTITDSNLFDAEHYSKDASIPAGVDALDHYLNSWEKLTGEPSQTFDTPYYLQQAPELRGSGMSPILHFLTLGWKNGIRPDAGRTIEQFLVDHHVLVDEYQPFDPLETPGTRGSAQLEHLGYREWRNLYGTARGSDLERMRQAAAQMENPPTISILMPVYNTNQAHLRQAIKSVRAQAYPHWELCIADDASTDPKVGVVLRHAASADERIKVVFREVNGNISASSNSALELATGEFIGLLDHDDLLAPDALYHYANSILEDPDVTLLYCDEDSLDAAGNHMGQHFKSAWNEELFLRQNYINHFSVYRRSAVEAVGGFRVGFEGSQDHDLALRVIAGSGGDQVRHIPRVLYTWRQFAGSGTFSDVHLDAAEDARRRAVRDYLSTKSIDATVERGPGGFNLIRYSTSGEELVSLLIPMRDQASVTATCIDSVIEKTTRGNYEILVVDNGSVEPESFALFDRLSRLPNVSVLDYPHEFNYSAINNFAASKANGSILGLLNNDVEVIEPDWLTIMSGYAARPGIGAVGAQLLYPDGRLQHSGVVIGLGWKTEGVAGHVHSFVERGAPGYFWRAQLTQAYSAVTAACLLVEHAKFDEVGGLDDENLKVAFNDVNLCLDLRAAGYTNLYAAEALLFHHESLSRGSDTEGPAFERFKRETRYMEEKWGSALKTDPFYNPNLNLDISMRSPFHGLSWPPRSLAARQIGRDGWVQPKNDESPNL